MAFQFQCPQGHLLEGDESQAGQAINCPLCGMLFLIPAPIPVAPEPAFAEQQVLGGPTGGPAFASAAAPAEPELLHIPCPNRHVLEVPLDMLDTDVLCPHCNEQFTLRQRDSLEAKKKRELAEERRERDMNKFWLNFSITAVVIVVLGLLTMIISSALTKPEPTPETKPKPKVEKAVEPAAPEPEPENPEIGPKASDMKKDD